MRKSAKILALLLAFVMLLGVVVTTAFANDDKAAAVHPNLTVSGEGITASEKIGNFEGSSYQGGVPYEMTGNTVEGSAAPLSPSYPATGNFSRKLGAAKTVDVKVGGETVNTYMRLYHDLADYPADNKDASGNWIGYNKDGKKDGMTSWSLASGYADVGTNYQELKKHSLIVNDYIVVDFDFMADMYKNRETKVLVDAIPAGADPTDYTLSYYSPISLCLRSNGTGIQTPSSLSFVEEDGVWYVYNTLSKATKLPLQQTPGVWNHFTVVYDIDNRVDYTYNDGEKNISVEAGKLAECIARGGVITSTYLTESKLYVYLDGKLLANVPMISNTAANKEESLELTIDEYRITAPSVDSDGWKNTYSIALDNMAAYFYAEGYQGDLATAYAADNVPEMLGAYADMVYNYNYQYSAPNAPVASIAVGDTVKNYYATEFALANIEEGCTLTLLGDAKVENYVAFCDFTVVCDEGEFSLAQCEKVANRTTSGYVITDANDNQKFKVLYYPSFEDAENYENEIEMEGNQNTATVDQPIYIPEISSGTFGEITKNGIEYKLITKWQLYYYVDEEEVEIIDLTPETVIDSAKLAVINRESSGEAYAYPVYGTVLLKYTVTDKDGNLVLGTDGDYSMYLDTTKFIDTVKAAPSGSTVTLYSDVDLANNTIAFGAISDHVLNIDLHGNRILSHAWSTNGMSNKPYIITIFKATNVDINIYSSVKGGEINATCYATSVSGDKYVEKRYVYGGVVSAGESAGCSVTFGRPGETYEEGYLTVYATILVEHTAPAKIGIDEPITVTLNGGKYIRLASDGPGFITVRDDMVLDINDIFFYTTQPNFIGTDASDDYKATSFDAEIDGSVIICTNTAGDAFRSVFGATSYAAAELTIRNSTLIGDFSSVTRGKIILGDKVKFAGVPSTVFAFDTNCASFDISSEKYPVDIKHYDIVYNITKDGDYVTDVALNYDSIKEEVSHAREFTMNYEVKNTDSVPKITVNWFDNDGSSLGTTSIPVGATSGFEAPEIADIDLDNPYFNIGFDKWVDENGNEFDFAACEAGKTYTAKATMKIVADFDGAFMNVLASIKFQPYVFVPVPDPKGYDGYEVVLGKTTTSITHYNGQAYYSFAIASYPTPTGTGSEVSFTMDYTVNDVPLSATVRTYDLPTYFEKAAELSDESGKKLIIAVVNFCNEAHRISKNSTYARYDALLEKYADLVPKIETYDADIAEDAGRIDFSKLAPYVNASYATESSMMPFFALSPANGVAIYPNLSEGTQYYVYPGGGNVSYSVEKFKGDSKYSVNLCENADTYTDPYGNGSFGQNYGTQISGGSFLYQFSANVPAYLLGNDMEITVRILPASAITVIEDGGKKTAAIDTEAAEYIKGTYNLATYIEGLREIDEPTVAEQNALEFAEALYMYYALAVEFQTTAEGN